jgi:hypothetical protein
MSAFHHTPRGKRSIYKHVDTDLRASASNADLMTEAPALVQRAVERGWMKRGIPLTEKQIDSIRTNKPSQPKTLEVFKIINIGGNQ